MGFLFFYGNIILLEYIVQLLENSNRLLENQRRLFESLKPVLKNVHTILEVPGFIRRSKNILEEI